MTGVTQLKRPWFGPPEVRGLYPLHPEITVRPSPDNGERWVVIHTKPGPSPEHLTIQATLADAYAEARRCSDRLYANERRGSR